MVGTPGASIPTGTVALGTVLTIVSWTPFSLGHRRNRASTGPADRRSGSCCCWSPRQSTVGYAVSQFGGIRPAAEGAGPQRPDDLTRTTRVRLRSSSGSIPARALVRCCRRGARLGDSVTRLVHVNRSDAPRELEWRASAAVQTAWSLDPNVPEAYLARGQPPPTQLAVVRARPCG